jgi:hypothetical protein
MPFASLVSYDSRRFGGRSGDYICEIAFRKRLAPQTSNHHIAPEGMPMPGPLTVA